METKSYCYIPVQQPRRPLVHYHYKSPLWIQMLSLESVTACPIVFPGVSWFTFFSNSSNPESTCCFWGNLWCCIARRWNFEHASITWHWKTVQPSYNSLRLSLLLRQVGQWCPCSLTTQRGMSIPQPHAVQCLSFDAAEGALPTTSDQKSWAWLKNHDPLNNKCGIPLNLAIWCLSF